MYKRILLAEDNEANITLFQNILEKIGFVVDVARTGETAVAYATTQLYDLILMDIGLPVYDGLVATRKIRGVSPPYANVKIYALTADDDKKMQDACKQVRMNGFLIKPISPVTLMKTVQRITTPLPNHDTG